MSDLFATDGIREKLGNDVAMTPKMKQAIREWYKAYTCESDWLKDDVESLNIPASIASEIARLVTIEAMINIKGSPRADFINSQLKPFIKNKKSIVEVAASVGGVMFKPYVRSNKIFLDYIYQDEMMPFKYDDNGNITGVIFPSYKIDRNQQFTRLEIHEFSEDEYRIQNKCYVSRDLRTDINYVRNLGTEVSLDSVDEWSDLEPDITIKGMDMPLYAFFKIPIANNIDRKSPLGISVYSRSMKDFRKADIQAARLDWEFASKEMAIDADGSLLEEDVYGNKILPKGKERIYRTYSGDNFSGDGKLFKYFSPEIRDEAFSRGFDKIMKRIEFNCGLAYGTISDPQNVDKTAEEIKMSKQRSYQLVKDIQESLQSALSDLVHVMDNICTAYNLVEGGEIKESYSWDDSIMVDAEKERESDRKDVALGAMDVIEYRMKWQNETEAEARKKAPEQAEVMP